MSDKRTKPRKPGQRTSDAPVDLVKEREAFVRTYLKRGVELTEDLIRENEQLRLELSQAQLDNGRLRAQVASDDAIRDLLRSIEGLEREKRDLLARSEALEAATARHVGRTSEIEQELNDLANLYVASSQLHASLSPRRVVRNIKEVLGQLVGAERFVIYVLGADGQSMVPIGSEGIAEAEIRSVPIGSDGPVAEACSTGVPYVRPGERPTHGTVEDPLAVIPLHADDRSIGAISIVALLAQKGDWAPVDRELFRLLGVHAAPALLAANLYATTSGPESALAGLRDHLSQ